MFTGIDSTVVDEKGRVGHSGLLLAKYGHVLLALDFTTLSTEIVDISLQVVVVGRCANLAVKQDDISVKRHGPLHKGVIVMLLRQTLIDDAQKQNPEE